MRIWKVMVLALVVAVGYYLGVCLRQDPSIPATTAGPHLESKPPESTEPRAESGGPIIDSSLIIPPMPDKAVVMDTEIAEIRAHFEKIHGWPKTRAGDHAPAEPMILFDPKKSFTMQSTENTGNDLRIRSPALSSIHPLPDEPPLIPSINLANKFPDPHIEYVQDRDIRLNYAVWKNGISGVKGLELWAQRAPAGEYVCMDAIAGTPSPLSSRLNSEGYYGLRLVLIGGTGIKSRKPRANDPPDYVLYLDTTPPEVALLPLRSDSPGTVTIRWEVKDAHLAEFPVRIKYSIDGQQWKQVHDQEDWLPNTQSYCWQVPADLPSEVFLMVQARDKAGNIGECRAHKKSAIDLTIPEGTIQGRIELLPKPEERPGPVARPIPPSED